MGAIYEAEKQMLNRMYVPIVINNGRYVTGEMIGALKMI